MKAWLVAVALVAVPASAAEKIWVDATCQTMLESVSETEFALSKTDGSHTSACKAAGQALTCDDGSKPKLERVGTSVVVDGLTLLPKGSSDILCD